MKNVTNELNKAVKTYSESLFQAFITFLKKTFENVLNHISLWLMQILQEVSQRLPDYGQRIMIKIIPVIVMIAQVLIGLVCLVLLIKLLSFIVRAFIKIFPLLKKRRRR